MTGKIGPEYQRLIDRIRAGIASGEYPVGTAIPSTAALAKLAGVSAQVVRRAVGQLETDGILEGHAGKGVFVRAMPEDAERERQDAEAVSREVAELRRQVEKLAAAPAARAAGVGDDLEALKQTVGRIEANLIDLYGKMGHEYPHSGTRDKAKAEARHGRAR